MALILAVTMVPALALPGVASAIEPSVNLPVTDPVPVQQEQGKSRKQDNASARAITGDQDPIAPKDGTSTLTATPLSPSATWDVGLHTGDFTWSYPLRVPPAPGGLVPSLALSYRSSAVDGRTSVTNNQPSWVGDGWDLWPGFVERTYGGCIDDDVPEKGDLCWRSDNATAAYGGGGGMLICCDDSTPEKRWRAKNDDGSRIERLWGAANGDKGDGERDTGEYWKITTVDGTQYFFGSQTDSQSTWTVPVFGDDAGEPCHGGSFDTSSCVQAWRWNLDKVVDRNGNMIRYFYQAESNRYGLNVKDAGADYIRGGVLQRIDYGLHESIPGPATGQVEFIPANRCLPGSDCRPESKGNWPDTPLEEKCDTPTCKGHWSPTFWSTQRLSRIITKVRRGSDYDEVDQWTLDQSFPNPGDGEKAALWLKSITHTGLAGAGDGDELPPVTFEGTEYPNRVDSIGDGYAPLVRFRITGIVSESGGVISVDYSSQCKPEDPKVEPKDNTRWCFPVTWSPPGYKERTDRFHKYVVSSVSLSDTVSSSIDHVTTYEYLDGAAWHWDTSEFVKEKKKTWNEFRGFGRVRVRTGKPTSEDPGSSPPSMSEHRFYRGMHGDKRPVREGEWPPTGSHSAQVSDSLNEAGKSTRDDSDWLQGFAFESTAYEGAPAAGQSDPPVVSRTVSYPVAQGPTATRGEFKSYIVGVETERGFTALKSGGWRETKAVTTYDDRGLPKTVSDLGDMATDADNRCTTTEYARNTGRWLLALPSTVKSVSVSCAATPQFPDNAISASQFSYDDKGNLTKTEVAKEWKIAAAPVYAFTGLAGYDGHGRVTTSNDALGAVSRVTFTPVTGGPVTGITTTSPATPTLPEGLVSTATLDPAFGQPTKVVDPNGQLTETKYDALGRVSKVWLPNRLKDGDPPNPRGSAEFSYLVRRNGPTVVTSTKVGPNGIHASSNTLYDGLLRVRQVQSPSVRMHEEPDKRPMPVEDGRLIVDTRYDSHGRAYKTTQPYFNDVKVDTNLWLAADSEVPGLTRTRFDGAGRVAETVYQAGALDKWKTTVAYDGDRVHTTPPAGGTATTVITDARGQITELLQYRASTPTGDNDRTVYKYKPAGQLAEVTGPDQAVWKFDYDLRGRKITAQDPDAGTSTMEYDELDRLTSTRDSHSRSIGLRYDALGRKTETRDTRTDTKLAQWTYDTAINGKGLGATSTRLIGNDKYVTSVDAYTALGKPRKASVTIPAAEGLLANIYPTDFGYGADGSLTGETYPQKGGLEAETVNYGLDSHGRPTDTKVGGVPLIASTFYTRYGEVERLEHGATPLRAWQSFYYDTNTRRLTRSIVDAEVTKPMQSDVHYTYDPAGNVTSMADLTADQTPDVQCFRYDHVRRLTEAWTAARNTWSEPDGRNNGGCTAEPTVANGPAPYRHSFQYGPGGNRLEETQRTLAATATRTYTYPATGQTQPHTLRSVKEGPNAVESFEYDSTGYTTRRVKPGADETFTWDVEGHLESVTNKTTNQTTSFIYTPDGTRLLRKDPTGTTLYLSGQELRLNKSGGDPVGTRYYTHGGKTVAMRQGKTLTWLAGDHQGTAQLAINTTTLAVTQRRQLPFGAPRGATLVWPNERGFVGGTMDSSTGLTHLGAREYDPGTGRFISVDPIMDVADPQQMHGYAYSNSNPITFSDPSGLRPGRSPDGGYSDDYGPGPTPPPPGGGGNGGHSGGGGSGSSSGRACGGRGVCGRTDNGDRRVAKDPPAPRPRKRSGDLDFFGKEHISYMSCGQSFVVITCGPEGTKIYPEQVRAVKEIGAELSGYNDSDACINHGDGWGCFWLVLGTGTAGLGRLIKWAVKADNVPVLEPCSFDGDTEVLMADGTTKPISKIKVGDEVLAADPESGEKGPRKVTAVMVHDDTVLDLVTEDGAKVTTTEDHPFYNATDKQWQRADELDPGDQLTTASARQAKVVGLRAGTTRVATAYNLTVQGIHTFYVLAGTDPVLVHNMCPQRRPDGGGSFSRVAMNMESVNSVAAKYGLDLSPFSRITFNKNKRSPEAFTSEAFHLDLRQGAFVNEAELARTLYHELVHVDQMRAGAKYPEKYDPNSLMEAQAEILAQEWWKNHPLNK